MKPAQISGIIPTFNRANSLQRVLNSAELASTGDLEIIVVDDGSTPPIDARALFGSKDRRFLIRHETSMGAPAARNSGISLAKGEYLLFLDDDELISGSIDKLVERSRCLGKEYGVIYVGHIRKYPSGKSKVHLPQEEGLLATHLLESPEYGTATMIRGDLLRDIDGIDSSPAVAMAGSAFESKGSTVAV
ncbi:MAG TPA: glycosyltransferase family A protein [Thermoanaerobaculia bacterium]|nr:glycosyltransferase family A protein [Thermoanaerobaculia bacterium]HUM29397.1 glycosyltransferase family A protein [Thermoanaerobaculia bacterium]HXK67643.1 glycosyltransferase family A protein [Thermoanaerobaculia bacterium]